MQSSLVSSDFTSKLLNLENPSPDDSEIASLMNTATIPPPLPSINPPRQQTTSTPTPTTSEATTVVPELLDFASVFRFNDRVTNLERDLLELKQVDQYAQAISSIPAIVDRYMDNKLGEAIHKEIQSHIAECREEAQAEKQEYIDNVDSTVRTIIREEVKTQLPKILPKVVSDFATPVIKRNVTESLEATVLARSSSQPKSTYEVVASLLEYELTKILLDKMEESKSHLRADYKKELYDALVKSYKTDKDLFNTYGEVFRLKRSRDDKDKDQDPSAGSDRGTKRRKSSKEAELSRDSRVQQDQEFDMRNNDEQPADKEVSKADWFKKPERPPTPDSDWNKRHHVDFRPPQTWISQVSHAKESQILVGPIFELLKGTYKSLTELEYHLEECSKAILKNSTGITLKASRIHSISVVTYKIKWIEDLVTNLWSPVKVVYDKHAYWGTIHWGPKRQHFYGFAANMTSSKDVYSRKRIIVVTRLMIMKKCIMPSSRDIDHHDTARYIPMYPYVPEVIRQEREIYKSLVNRLFHEGRVVLPDLLESKPNLRTTFAAIGFDCLLDINEQIYRNRLTYFTKVCLAHSKLNGTLCIGFVIDNVETVLTLENFGRILKIPYKGVCLYSFEWSISSLQRSCDPHPNLYPPPHEDPSLVRDALFHPRTEPKTRTIKSDSVTLEPFQMINNELRENFKK
ncbi:hypothetical protein Tco_1044587 [Tanacetum coccineum]|uniref:Uncharacterized protein n=1 Tax=Tanacetum coccineum TaxID=301880 RepID=A0ABQ5GSA1_9ASTR